MRQALQQRLISYLMTSAICWFIFSGAAWAVDKRFAVLIGNQAYDTSVGVLKNPHNDIALVADALRGQGFEILPLVKDARRAMILGAVRELVQKLNSAGAGAIGFFYYSGHGAAEKDTNINYLIPVDARDPGSAAFWDESLKLDDITRLLDGARGAVKFVVFDACRSELQLPTRDTSKGCCRSPSNRASSSRIRARRDGPRRIAAPSAGPMLPRWPKSWATKASTI